MPSISSGLPGPSALQIADRLMPEMAHHCGRGANMRLVMAISIRPGADEHHAEEVSRFEDRVKRVGMVAAGGFEPPTKGL